MRKRQVCQADLEKQLRIEAMLGKISLEYKMTLFSIGAGFLMLVNIFLGGYIGYLFSISYNYPMLILIGGFVGLIIGGIIRFIIFDYIYDFTHSYRKLLS